MRLLKKRFPTLEEQISRLSPKCRELTDEESRLVNGGGPSVWDTYNGTGCPYEYTTVPKDPPAETTTPASNTPANKTTEIAETTATDTANQTPEQETGNATSSPTSISTPVSQTPIADYVRKVVNTAFELQKKNFGKEYIEMDYQGQHILVARAGNAKSIEQAAQYYFTTGKDGVIGNKVVDAIAVADENGNIIHKFSSDNAITAYETLMCKNQSLKSDLFNDLENLGNLLGFTSFALDNAILGKASSVLSVCTILNDLNEMNENPNSCGVYDIVTDFISLFGPIGLYTSIEMSNVHQQIHELEPILQDNYKDYRLNQFNKIYSANDYTNFDLINDSVYEDVKCIWNNLIGGIKS